MAIQADVFDACVKFLLEERLPANKAEQEMLKTCLAAMLLLSKSIAEDLLGTHSRYLALVRNALADVYPKTQYENGMRILRDLADLGTVIQNLSVGREPRSNQKRIDTIQFCISMRDELRGWEQSH